MKQLTQIERRQTHICRIRARVSTDKRVKRETVACTPQEHHHIGHSQNQYEHIGTFLRKYAGDPAIKVRDGHNKMFWRLNLFVQNYLPKLKEHLLHHILPKLGGETLSQMPDPRDCDPDTVLFRHDRIYQHNILRINFTSYDVRRSQDVVNALTSHCNIMVLADSGEDNKSNSTHPFRYAQVLGTHHVNAVYVDPGMLNYQPHRMEFLWVRWYKNTGVLHNRWDEEKLDRICFTSVTEDDTFRFIDPSAILRSCHIIPAFARGRLHDDGKGMSVCAKDSSDWNEYYVNRSVCWQ